MVNGDDHVAAANAAIQSARNERGELSSSAVRIAAGERAMVSDIVATRRNDHTLTVSAIGRHGTAVLYSDCCGTTVTTPRLLSETTSKHSVSAPFQPVR